MRKIKTLLKPYKSLYAAKKDLNIYKDSSQLQRWLTIGALVDSDGQVWIKTAKPIKGWEE
tara:strand:- start:1117 stop:1296 length:180 start_codon:yes stop_codon:yes gene_type:complete